MSSRPAYLLRARDFKQFLEWKRLAAKAHISLNEWILKKIESEAK